eukprot:363309-Chlamydomonas_euryale.AAC.41
MGDGVAGGRPACGAGTAGRAAVAGRTRAWQLRCKSMYHGAVVAKLWCRHTGASVQKGRPAVRP